MKQLSFKPQYHTQATSGVFAGAWNANQATYGSKEQQEEAKLIRAEGGTPLLPDPQAAFAASSQFKAIAEMLGVLKK